MEYLAYKAHEYDGKIKTIAMALRDVVFPI
jgi:hypothetical protein